MGKKIFVSYKYGDSLVKNLPGQLNSTVRDYVDVFQSKLEEGDHINKGENDGEDLSDFKDSTITSKLRDKIYDSTVTVVLISKGMKEAYVSEDDQWIPWEISYSLKESTRNGVTSQTNAVLAVILPESDGTYNHFMEYNNNCDSTTIKTNSLFTILAKNMFNIKEPNTKPCNRTTIYYGAHSYIHHVKWDAFIKSIDLYVQIALSIQKDKEKFDVVKVV